MYRKGVWYMLLKLERIKDEKAGSGRIFSGFTKL